MRLVIIFFVFLFSASGCKSPVGDMVNNNFVSISPQAVPSDMVGYWTGNIGPYLTSFSFNDDGSGLFCYSYGTTDVIYKIKYYSNIVYIQDGTKLDVEAFSDRELVVNADYFAGHQSTFFKDQSLKEASKFCSSNLAE